MSDTVSPMTKHHIMPMLLFGGVIWLQAWKGDFKQPSVSNWERVTTDSVYTDLDECEKALAFRADAFEFIIRQRDPAAKRHDKAFLSNDGTYLYGHQFFCLPDTVDPRGPKEGAR